MKLALAGFHIDFMALGTGSIYAQELKEYLNIYGTVLK
jgi:hypothetical protein